MPESGESIKERSPPPLKNVANVSIAKSTPTAPTNNGEQVPGTLCSKSSAGWRRSPRLISLVSREEGNVSVGNKSGSNVKLAVRSPPAAEILSQNAYSQPSLSLGSSNATNYARRSLASVINNDNFGMDLSAKNFACCFSDSDEEGGFDPFSPLLNDDDGYIDDEIDIVKDEITEIYDNVETNILSSSDSAQLETLTINITEVTTAAEKST